MKVKCHVTIIHHYFCAQDSKNVVFFNSFNYGPVYSRPPFVQGKKTIEHLSYRLFQTQDFRERSFYKQVYAFLFFFTGTIEKNMKFMVRLLVFFYLVPGIDGTENITINTMEGFNISRADACSQNSSTYHSLMAVFSLLVVFVSVAGNLLSIIVIQTSRHLRGQIAYVFVTSLAVADLGVSLFVTTVKVGMHFNNGSFCYNLSMCGFLIFADGLFPISSISHLVMISIDRWYAIAYPYAYVSSMNRTRAKSSIMIIWVYSLLWSMMGIFLWNNPSGLAFFIETENNYRVCHSSNKYYHTTILLMIYIIPISFTTILYMIILQIALKQASAISKGNASERKFRKKRFKTDTKAAKTVSSVFLAYTVCWVPHVVVVMLYYWSPHILSEFVKRHPNVYDVVSTVAHRILPPLSSCVNPFIYFIVGTQFRLAFSEIYHKVLGNPSHENIEHKRHSLSLTVCENKLSSMGRAFSRTNSFYTNNSQPESRNNSARSEEEERSLTISPINDNMFGNCGIINE